MTGILRAAVIVSAALCVYAIRQVDPDLYGYLAYGRLFVEQGLSAADPFAYTSSGLRWVSFEYLAQIVLWEAYSRFGPVGLIALKCVLGGFAIYFLFAVIKTVTNSVAVLVPVFLLCASTASRYFLFRPQLFTFVFFAFYVLVLFRFLLNRHPPLWPLVVVMLVWANTHGGFLAGLAAIALVIAIRVVANVANGLRARAVLHGTGPLWLALAGCAAITLVNPQGLRLWEYILTELVHDTNRRLIAEWRPPGLESDPWSAVVLSFTTIVLVFSTWAAQVLQRRVAGLPPWLWLVSCAPALALAYTSVRHVPLAALWVAPVIGLLAAAASSAAAASWIRSVWVGISACVLIPIIVTIQHVLLDPRPAIAARGSTLGSTHPCTAVVFMKHNRMAGNLFTPLWWGSYVSWELYPDVRVSMDGRNISLFPQGMVEENLRFYQSDSSSGDLEAPFRYATDMILIPADRPVVTLVRADARWREVFHDDQSSLFVRVKPPDSTPTSSDPDFIDPPAQECANTLR